MDKILIVDGKQASVDSLKEILSGSGNTFEIREASSGSSALAEIKKDTPDIILLEIHHGDTKKFATLRELQKEENGFIPILILSSTEDQDENLLGLEYGATDFVRKPFNPADLIARIMVQINLKRMFSDKSPVSEKSAAGIARLYKELQHKNEELKRMDQLKTDFVSTVSHELRTPLAITTEGLNLVLDGIPGTINEKQTEILKTSQENLDRLRRIINDLLDISKIEAGKVEARREFVDFKKLLEGLVKSYHMVVKSKNITLSLSLCEEDSSLLIDKDKIIQVLNNLLNNAYKFTPDDGQIEIGLKLQDSHVLCSVKDSGVGVAKEDMEKLFSKFQQFGRKDGPGIKGTGLGLAITKTLVNLHQGEIWCESEVDKGTTFFFTLPRYDALQSQFNKNFDDILREANARSRSAALVMFDLFNFEEIREKCGNDELIELMNSRLAIIYEIVSNPNDKVFLCDDHRIHIILHDANKVGAAVVVKRLKEAISKLEYIEEQNKKPDDKPSLHADIKMGIAVYPLNGRNREGLINSAYDNMTRKKLVLIIDDHPQIVRLLELRLAEEGYDIRYAYNGKDALHLLQEDKLRPDLIILDIVMPEMNGYEFYGRLKGDPELCHIPVILLTAHELDMGKLELITPGYVPVVQKTGGCSNLVDVIQSL